MSFQMPSKQDPTAGLAGMNQGHEGMAQGGTGAMEGQFSGPYEGMMRSETGGMEPNPLNDFIQKMMPEIAHLFGGGQK